MNARRTFPAREPLAWCDSPWRIAGRAVSSALVVVVLAVIAALLVVPRVLGGTSVTVLTGSMVPTFSPGDVVVIRGIEVADVCSEVAIGDIVTFMPTPNDPTLITHRVVAKTIGTFPDGTTCQLVTQGDANSAADDPVSPAQVRGVFLFGVPKLGWVRQWAGDNTQLLLIVGAAILIAAGIWSVMRRPRTRTYTMPAPNTDEREIALRERELALRIREEEFSRRLAEQNETPGEQSSPPQDSDPNSPCDHAAAMTRSDRGDL